ncbi:hypothetical protein SASPL_106973 [Salvia splendens]|uniref:Agglutinin domain-containing protein n=1 Tax=Salvia splendens TaxID=180675 RepID=A0A8X8YCL1_SALSN|nr:uncharacterized protein LOC121794244 [Salvia splendens]XP_042048259.1 uncharacterized protein LOC121794244 [Salvia splendens]XP_042048260.1 uncharacterized protein LOC121794244 [Salvia splendens]XP_042048261.1 uncharacterized protein LOC121794244 [Salvia splendens]KAG6428934.1 hypothetical protein SASPL_106973 [Salvia splendens]
MATWALPKVVVIKFKNPYITSNLYRRDNGAVASGAHGIYGTSSRIEVEKAKSNDKYVNLRFLFTNRYMHRTSDASWAIAAVSPTPQEDLSDPLCTLFEPIKVDNADDDANANVFYLIHAQSGGRLVIDDEIFVLRVEFNLSSTTQGYLRAVDFDSLVRLHKRRNLAFKGDNGKYLKAFTWGNKNYLQFSSDIPNDSLSRHEASVMLDGIVQLTSIHLRSHWNLSDDGWIFGNANPITSLHDPNTHFWPIKINANTIALRAADGKFCRRRVTNNLANGSIGTEQSSPTKEAELQVEELVTKSLVNNVRYEIEYGRVFDETPHTGWSSTVVNSQDVDVTSSLSFTYQDTKEYTFAHDFTLETGVPTFFDAALPFVGKDGSIDEAAAKINAQLQWNAVNSTTRTVTGNGSIVVPAKSSAVVSYVGKRGTYNVPFKYTQVDTVDQPLPVGSPPVDVESEGIDGLYTATNLYGFKLVMDSIQAI